MSDCTQVWDVLALRRYSTSAMHRNLLLAKINWHVFLAVLLLFPKWQPLLLHPQENTWEMAHLLNTAYLPSPACRGLLPCPVLPGTLWNNKAPFSGVGRNLSCPVFTCLLSTGRSSASLLLAMRPTDAQKARRSCGLLSPCISRLEEITSAPFL